MSITELERHLELIVDSREVNIGKIQDFFANSSKTKVKVLTETLDVGDFLFRYSNGDKLILIERKTISDLLSSIKVDNRYKEQKIRLKALAQQAPGLRVYYMIEGIFSVQPVSKYFTDIDRKIVVGAYVGTMIRDQIPVLNTKDFNDTLQTLLKIANLIIEYPESFGFQNDDNSDNEYAVAIKIKKSENKDVRWCYLAQLQQIPGVSEQVAIEIAEKYPNLQ